MQVESLIFFLGHAHQVLEEYTQIHSVTFLDQILDIKALFTFKLLTALKQLQLLIIHANYKLLAYNCNIH